MKKSQPKCSIIIVTYNSEKYLNQCLQAIHLQTHPPDQIILVDTGSKNTAYLKETKKYPNVLLKFAEKNSGFCNGNNVGFRYLSADCDYVFFLNPDAFLHSKYIEEAIAFLEKPENSKIGAVTGRTLGYDIDRKIPTGNYDTTGVFRTWYGKWYDRGQGQNIDQNAYQREELLPAICGAVFFSRKKALEDVTLKGKQIFNLNFYMYKEDIDLSLRLRRKGWNLVYLPQLIAYHCRGWNVDRKKMDLELRLYSARNEFTLQVKSFHPIGIIYSFLKYTAVALFNM